ncbi:MAG: biotin-dependent carboxyltransferase [Spirochaetia bacterium]|nr:biotin-dependent carboxyltransferase [Spirochaetia bacterium]
MTLHFETSGFLTNIQDGGRFGYQDIGISPSGPMDRHSFNLANILVGNPMDEAALEITFTGPDIKFDCDNVIAITGADMSPTLEGEIFPMYEAMPVKAGQTLRFGRLNAGLRSYLAVSGGLDVPIVMGSRSTLIRNQIGGYEGRAIRKGDVIGLRSPHGTVKHINRRVILERLDCSNTIEVRVIRGPQDDRFTQNGLETFFKSEYKVTNEFDRMGCRLEGPKISHVADANIISDGIVTGSIQVPGTGFPIVMLADRQSTGGYTKIATVISEDLPKMGQAKPGNVIRFIETDVATAQKLYIKERKYMERLQRKWRIKEES